MLAGKERDLHTSFRNVFCVSSSQRISSFMTITSPVALWVTYRRSHSLRVGNNSGFKNSGTKETKDFNEMGCSNICILLQVVKRTITLHCVIPRQ